MTAEPSQLRLYIAALFLSFGLNTRDLLTVDDDDYYSLLVIMIDIIINTVCL